MTKFKRVEIIDASWLSGRIEPVIFKKTGLNTPTETRLVFKADMRDIVAMESDQIDEVIAELQAVKEKMREMDLELHPPEPEPEQEVPVEPPVEETPEP